MHQLHATESTRQIPAGPHSENLAAALAVEAVRAGLTRVDRVELNDRGTLARAVQVHPLRDEPGLNRMTDPIDTAVASRQPLAHASEQLRDAVGQARAPIAQHPSPALHPAIAQ